MQNIKIVSCLEQKNGYSLKQILSVLNTEKISMEQGTNFTGRPSTTIHAADGTIVKLKADARFDDEKTAYAWAEKFLARERLYGIHHPAKTWFTLQQGGQFICGNATPLLTPLHLHLGQSDADAAATDNREHCKMLTRLLAFYLQFSAEHNLRMDEGLSNFGLDASGKLFYLDDDIYPWDDFLSLTQMLGVYLRTLSWLNEDIVRTVSSSLYHLIIRYYHDINWIKVVQELFDNIFVPPCQKEIFAAFSDTLLAEMSAVFKSRKKGKSSLQLQDWQPEYHSGKVAILADIHANMPALQAVLDDIQQQGINQAIALGDLVGYGPHPSECIRALVDAGVFCIKGNHDHAAASPVNVERFSNTGKLSNAWTRTQLNDAEKQWLLHLPPIYRCSQFMAVHGAPIDKTFFHAYVYHMTYESNLDYLQKQGINLCFHGHSHLAGAYCRDRRGVDKLDNAQKLEIRKTSHYLYCPGSVGQPRDGVAGARYAIYDLDRQRILQRHIDYEIDTLLRDMADRKQPDKLRQLQDGLLRGR